MTHRLNRLLKNRKNRTIGIEFTSLVTLFSVLSYIGGAGFNWVIIIAPIVICIIDYKYLYRERVDGYEIPDIPMTNSNKFLKKLDKTHKNQKRNYD